MSVRAYIRLRSVRSKTIPGTKPPPSVRTFCQVYVSAAAAARAGCGEWTAGPTRAVVPARDRAAKRAADRWGRKACPLRACRRAGAALIDGRLLWERSHERGCLSFPCQEPETNPPRKHRRRWIRPEGF